MPSRAIASGLRVFALIVLVIAATSGGRQLVPMHDQVSTPNLAQLNPPTVTATTLPTNAIIVTPTPTQQSPTQVPTVAPTVQPTEMPEQGRGNFVVPENTTDQSIIVERGPTDKNYVALTFDAGEGRGYTEEILDFLKEHGIHASFGTTGEWARENPDLIKRILDEGHLLFNHSESHQSWTGESPGTEPLTDEQRTEEILGVEQAVDDIAGWSMQPFWRPPYGDWDPEGQVLLKSLGYDYTLYWTCDSLGWNGLTAEEIAEWCGPDTERTGPGAIILFHVAQEQDFQSLQYIVEEYSAQGYEFVTMDKMIAP